LDFTTASIVEEVATIIHAVEKLGGAKLGNPDKPRHGVYRRFFFVLRRRPPPVGICGRTLVFSIAISGLSIRRLARVVIPSLFHRERHTAPSVWRRIMSLNAGRRPMFQDRLEKPLEEVLRGLAPGRIARVNSACPRGAMSAIGP